MLSLFATSVAVAVPDWLANVDLWSAVIGAVVVLVGVKYPVLADVLKSILASLRGKPASAAAVQLTAGPTGGALSDWIAKHPNLIPLIQTLLPILLPLLMAKHGTPDPAKALALEVARAMPPDPK